MNQLLHSTLACTALITDDRSYSIVGLPLGGLPQVQVLIGTDWSPFWAILVDKNELSLILLSEAWAARADRFTQNRIPLRVTAGYHLITFDVALPPNLVGFLAHFLLPLAGAGIPIMAFSAHSRDHLLVAREHFSTAVTILEKRLDDARPITD